MNSAIMASLDASESKSTLSTTRSIPTPSSTHSP
jgi:hypothetical protein